MRALPLIALQVIDRQQSEHQLTARVGDPLMYALRDAQLGVEAICGGSCICATCHVFLQGEWPEESVNAGVEERQLLAELVHTGDRSRLSCQVTVTENMEGCALQIAPEEV